MDNETKQAFEAMGTRMGAMETRLLQRIEQTDARIQTLQTQFLERIEQTETRLLSAFHGWSTTMELRLKSLPATEQRLAVLEDRLSAVERKMLQHGL